LPPAEAGETGRSRRSFAACAAMLPEPSEGPLGLRRTDFRSLPGDAAFATVARKCQTTGNRLRGSCCGLPRTAGTLARSDGRWPARLGEELSRLAGGNVITFREAYAPSPVKDASLTRSRCLRFQSEVDCPTPEERLSPDRRKGRLHTAGRLTLPQGREEDGPHLSSRTES
jgi:hypothetical protein